MSDESRFQNSEIADVELRISDWFVVNSQSAIHNPKFLRFCNEFE
jgi:hypothetical protein